MTAPLRIQHIPLDQLRASPTNPRKLFPEAAIADLAASLKEKGILQPLLVRLSNKAGIFEVISGESRMRAAKIAQLAEVPCILRELTDQEVVEFQIIENVQRKDLEPLEEALGYQLLHDRFKYEYDELAAKIGKSKSYVYRRLQLLGLSEKTKAALAGGTLPTSWAEAMITLGDHSTQDQVVARIAGKQGYNGTIESLREFRELLDELRHKLAAAPFDTKDPDLVKKAGACAACPKRTGAQADLLGDTGKDDLCLDGGCWTSKVNTHNAAIANAARAEGKKVITGREAENFHAYQHNMVELTGGKYELKGKTWAQALEKTEPAAKARVKITAVITDEGVKEFAKEADLRAAVPRSMFGATYAPKAKAGESTAAEKNARKKRLLEQKATRAAWPGAWKKVVDTLAARELKGAALGQLVHILAEDVITDYSVRKGIEERTGKNIKALLAGAKSDTDYRALLIHLAMGPGLYDTKLADFNCGSVELFKIADVDWIKERNAAADELKADKTLKALSGSTGRKAAKLGKSGTTDDAIAAAKAARKSKKTSKRKAEEDDEDEASE